MNSGPNLPVRTIFLGSTDGENWGECDPEEMIQSVENGDAYFISDLGCRTYLSVDNDILENLTEWLNMEMPVIFLDTDAWEEGELGDLVTLPMRDAIHSMNFDL